MNTEYKYKTDLHCHTSEASDCASECGADTVEKYIRLGYSSVVITNHFSRNHLNSFGGEYEAFADRFFEAASAARRAAGGRINVLTGMELKAQPHYNEYLIYGVTREMMAGIPDVFTWYIDRVHEYFAEQGCVVIQSHPMRYGITNVEPEFLDGYEILNAHTAWNSHNDVAELWAREVGGEGKILTAGTDHHDPDNIPTAGILTTEPIVSSSQLTETLKSGRFKIFSE